MKAKRQLLIIGFLFLFSIGTISCNTNRLKVERYFRDYSYDTSLDDVQANEERFEPNYIGFKIKGRSRFLGFPLELANVVANQRSGGYKGLMLRTMPNSPQDKVVQKFIKQYGEASLEHEGSYIWDKGTYCVILDTSDLSNGSSIEIYHHKGAFQPFQDFEWGTDRSVIEEQIGQPNQAEGDEAGYIYTVDGEYDGHEAIIKYTFEHNKLSAIDCKLAKQTYSKDYINYDAVPNKAVRDVHETLVEQYGEEDNRSSYSGILVLEWNFGTSKIFYYESDDYMGGRSLSVSFHKAPLSVSEA